MPVHRLLPLVLRIPLCLMVCCSTLPADTVDDVAKTRENLLEVIQLRESLANEERAWNEQQELMEGQLRLDRQALDQLERELAAVQPELESLLSESTRLKADLEETTQLIEFWKEKLELLRPRLAKLVDSFPPGLKRDLAYKLQDVEALDAEGDDAIKRAFDICLEVASEANAWHQDVHLLTEIHDLGDGLRGEFSVVYLGLSGGYYFSEKAQTAGLILWDGQQWNWVEDNALLPDLLVFSSVVSGQQTPQFMNLPVRLVEEGAP